MPEPFDTAVAAARAAGGRLLEYFGRDIEVQFKESYNPCSEADLAANETIISEIRAAFPDHSILSEETPRQEGDPNHLWIIDPLDGTNNFLHGIPHFAVSLAYYRRGRPEAGIVYQPCGDQMFSARRGAGAELNGQALACAEIDALEKALIAVGFYYDRGDMMIRTLDAVRRLFERQIHGIRRFGCASLDLCYVAAGRYGAFFEYALSPWDFAAGRLIVEEAGGTITTCSGEPLPLERTSLLAAGAALHPRVLEVIRENPAA